MKIAFHNRQRLIKADTARLGRLFQRLAAIAAEELAAAPPPWLKKRQLRQIFSQGQLSLVFVSDRTIRKINREWRSIDKATDVLSFPLELTAPPWLQTLSGSASESEAKGQNGAEKAGKNTRRFGKKSLDFDHDCPDDSSIYCQSGASAEAEPWIVGEVIISLERAREQASEYGHSVEREIAFLFVHGLLHVLGFDHMNKADEKEMFGRQRRILSEAGIKRN